MDMMVIRSVSLFSLLCLGGGAFAQSAMDFSALEFFPQPLGARATDADPRAAERAPAPPGRPSPSRPAGSLQSEPSAELRESIVRRRDSALAIEARNGPRARALADELVSLADLYREAGDHPLAIGTLERALDVVHINEGLYSLDQVPIIERIIQSRIAIGDYDEAAVLDESVLELVFRNPRDSRVVSILTTIADREMQAVNRFLEHGSEPPLNISVRTLIGPEWDRPPALTPRQIALGSLRRARRHYHQAIIAAQQTSGRDVAELFAIEDKMIQTLYVEVTEPDLQPAGTRSGSVPPFVFASGEAVFEAHVANSVNLRRTAVAVARALLKLGDWQLLFSKNGTALETYQIAHDLLVGEGVAADVIAEMLTPSVPVALPMTDPTPSAAEASAHRGYVDVSFVLSRYGSVRHVEAVGASANTPGKIRKLAKQHVSMRRFRPRFAHGVPARADRVAVRYYYDY
jgi:hypothetical protein